MGHVGLATKPHSRLLARSFGHSFVFTSVEETPFLILVFGFGGLTREMPMYTLPLLFPFLNCGLLLLYITYDRDRLTRTHVGTSARLGKRDILIWT